MAEPLTREQIIANRRKWAEALESGEYEQCRNRMHKNGRFCCLGVALMCLDGSVPAPSEEVQAHYNRIGELVGINDRIPFIEANDDLKKTFPEIAAMVRALPDPEVKP